jgi:hypothetical protein
MLVQCDVGEIRLLPELPSAWRDGHVTGLRTRGGFEIDLSWKHGALERASIRSLLGRPLRVRRGNTLRTFDTTRGATLTLVGDELQQDRGVAILQVDADRRFGTIDRRSTAILSSTSPARSRMASSPSRSAVPASRAANTVPI